MKIKPLILILLISLLIVKVYAQGDSFDTAEEIRAGVQYSYYLDRVYHYFKVYISSGQSVRVILDGPDDNNVDFDLRVYNQYRNRIASSLSSSADEEVSFQTDVSGYYYIEIIKFEGSGWYNLKVEVGGSGGGGGGGNIPVIGDIINFLNQIRNTIQEIINTLANFFNNIANAINNFTSAVQNAFSSLVEAIQNVFNAIADGIKGIFESIWDAINSVIEGITKAVSSFVEAITNGISRIADGIRNIISGIANFIGSIINGINDVLGGLVGGVLDFFGGIGSGAGEFIEENGLVALAVLLIVVGIVFFRPALIFGILLLTLWGLQNIGVFGDNAKYFVMVVLAIAGLAILSRR